MKKTAILLAALLLILCCMTALAEENGEGASTTSGLMKVIKCEEWVSLREKPDTKSDRLYKVPLNALVYDCYKYDEKFYVCEYEGIRGYIRYDYLEEIDPCLDWMQDECRIVAYRSAINEKEYLNVVSFAGDGEPVWSYQTAAAGGGQFYRTMAFIGGTVQDPKIMVQNSDRGLTMLSLWDGTEIWTLSKDVFNLGSGNCAAVSDDGIIYIAGFDGPTPVAISPEGSVLWQSVIDDPDVFWPYEIEPRRDEIAVRYGSAEMENGEGAFYEVILDTTGNVKSVELVCPG